MRYMIMTFLKNLEKLGLLGAQIKGYGCSGVSCSFLWLNC